MTALKYDDIIKSHVSLITIDNAFFERSYVVLH